MPPFQVVFFDEFFKEIVVAEKDVLSEIKDEWNTQIYIKAGLYDRMELRLNGEALEVATWNREEKKWDIAVA